MKESVFTVKKNTKIAADIYEMKLSGDTSDFTSPGQFAEIRIPGFYLRRPISVCDIEGGVLTLIYKTVGAGTDSLSRVCSGGTLDLLTGLGNGYDLSKSGEAPLVIGGGVGIPPMYLLCKRLTAEGKTVTAALGFNTSTDMFYVKEFEKICPRVIIATADGSYGVRGFITDAAKGAPHTFYYACGPRPMLDSTVRTFGACGQISLEERMGCGFGACMGCSVVTKSGARRVCKDGPVFDAGEIYFGGDVK